jgi:hypothetical protein
VLTGFKMEFGVGSSENCHESSDFIEGEIVID